MSSITGRTMTAQHNDVFLVISKMDTHLEDLSSEQKSGTRQTVRVRIAGTIIRKFVHDDATFQCSYEKGSLSRCTDRI